MQLRKLTVKNFRNIGHAQVDFGPGLNVLYGPNELGKSGLAEAIRAAFLVRPGSAAARQFIPWGSQLVPEVIVEFDTWHAEQEEEPDNGDEDSIEEASTATAVTRRLTKEFSRNGKASLHRLPASGGAILEAEGRAVEGDLQAILGWGIKPPGGKGSAGKKDASGMPVSYLTTALLGRQDRVAEIFTAELTQDRHESGRDALALALGALGQDPLVESVLRRLDKELKPVFSEKSGQHRRGQDSPIVQMTEKVKAQEQVVLKLERLQHESRNTQERFDAARKRQQELADRGKVLQESVTHWQTMQQALLAVHEACEHSADIESLRKELTTLREQQQDAERLHTEADKNLKECESSLSEAEKQQVAAQTNLEQLSNSRHEAESANREKHEASRSRCDQALERSKELQRISATRRDLEQQLADFSQRLEAQQIEVTHAERLLKVSELSEQLNQEQANAKIFDDSQKRCQQAEVAYQQQVDELNRSKKQLAAAEQEREESRERLQAAKESLGDASQSGNARVTQRSSLENRLRKAQGDYRLVKQLEDKRLQRDGHQQSVKELQEQKSRLDQQITDAEKNELTARSAAVRWRIGLAVAAVLLAAGFALAFAVPEQQVLGFIIAGVGAAGSAATFILQSQHIRTANASAAERAADGETRREVSSRLFLAESNVTSAENDYENASNECAELLTAKSISLNEALDHVKTATVAIDKFDSEPRDEILAHRTQAVAVAEAADEAAEIQVRELKQECDRLQQEANECHAAVVSAQTQMKPLKRLTDDELADMTTRLAAGCTALGLDPESQIITSVVATEQLSESRATARELQEEVNIMKAKLNDSNGENRIAELIATLSPVARALGDDLCEKFERGPDEDSLSRIVEHIEIKRNGIDEKLNSISDDKDEEIRTTEGKLRDALKLIETRKLDQQKASQKVTTAAGLLSDVNRQMEVKQHQLKQQAESGDPKQQLRMSIENYSGALSDWQQYLGRLDDGQLACLSPADLPDASSLLNVEALQAEATSMPLQFDDQRKQLEAAVDSLTQQLEANQSDTKKADESRHTLQGELQKVVGPAIEEEVAQAQEELARLQKQSKDLEEDFDAWKHLRDSLRKVDEQNSAHLGRQLAQPVQQAFRELTENRYGELTLSKQMSLDSITAQGDSRNAEEMSIGTRDQLATLIRMTLAAQLQSVLVLDDQLAHSDTERMKWFRERLRNSSNDHQHQIVVVTCRCEDYVDQAEQPDDVRVIDMAKKIRPVDLEGESGN